MSEDSAIAIEEEGLATPVQNGHSFAPISRAALPPGVAEIEFEAILAIGREKGQLTQEELVEALPTVELTPGVLTALIERVTAAGVALVAEETEEEPEQALEEPVVKEAKAVKETAPKANGASRSETRRTNGKRTASAGESAGSAEDPVHTYLKEIGRVPLLNAELEVEIAQTIEEGNAAAARLATIARRST